MAGQFRVSCESRKHISRNLRLCPCEMKRQLISLLRNGHGKRRTHIASTGRRERYPVELSIHLLPPEV